MARPWQRPPRVALFTDTFDEISGVGHTFRRLADWSAQRGLGLDIFTVAPDRSSREERGSVTIHRVKPRVPFNYYPGLYFDLVPIDDTVLAYGREQDYDVIHVATPGHIGITGIYLAGQMSRPLLGSYHTELPKYVSQRLVGHLDAEFDDDDDAREYVAEVSGALTWDYLTLFYNHCQQVLVPSRFTWKQVAERLRPPLDLFPRGVDTTLFTPQRRQRAEGPPRVLYVGRLAVEKNLEWLVAFGTKYPEVELMIVGDGPERGALEQALPHAQFPGFLRDEALAQAYADADVFAFPSLTETFGNVVLEAQASGLPAVVGHLGGPSEIIEPGRTGLVASTSEEFTAHLLALLGDPTRRAAYASAARARAKTRSWDEVFEQLFATWRAACYPARRRLWLRLLRNLKQSQNPFAVGLVSFWRQFGRNRANRPPAPGETTP